MRLALVALLVPSYEAGLAFFVEGLGWDLLEDSDHGGGKRWVRVAPTGAPLEEAPKGALPEEAPNGTPLEQAPKGASSDTASPGPQTEHAPAGESPPGAPTETSPSGTGAATTAVQTAPASPRTEFLLARAEGDQRAAIGNQGGGRVWLFLHSDDFARDHARLTAAGATFEEAPRVEPYGTVAVFRDPFGNRWDLIEPA